MAAVNITANTSRGRGRGIRLLQPGETPVARHTRASGFRDFIQLEARTRASRGQQQLASIDEERRGHPQPNEVEERRNEQYWDEPSGEERHGSRDGLNGSRDGLNGSRDGLNGSRVGQDNIHEPEHQRTWEQHHNGSRVWQDSTHETERQRTWEQHHEPWGQNHHAPWEQNRAPWGEWSGPQPEVGMSQGETRRLMSENEQHRKEVAYYYQRRLTLYLLNSRDHEDVVKPGLSATSLEALKKVLETMKTHHQKADDNFSLLRRSEWFGERDIEEHEAWFRQVNEELVSLFEQIADQEKNNNTTAGASLQSPNVLSVPIASSERYVPSVVEPLKLDSFIGLPGTYRTFKTRFTLIMKKSNIDSSLQAEHLLRCLSGEPLRIVMLVDLLDPGALGLMWEKLDERFGNEQCEHQHHVTELQKLASYPPCKTSADLQELYYTFSEHIYAIRRLTKSCDTGEDYKTTLCNLLPDYLKRKMYKIMYETPEQYTLNHMMKIVGKNVGLSHMESTVSGKEMGRLQGNFGKEPSNPWVKSRADAERRAQACAGKLSGVYQIEPGVDEGASYSMPAESRVNTVTVGQETFSIPGQVARVCYRVNREAPQQSPGNHYSFTNCTVPPITSYMSEFGQEGIGGGLDQTGVLGGVGTHQQTIHHTSQMNAAQSGGVRSNSSREAMPYGSKTINLTPRDTDAGCIFCKANHASLDCRAFELGNQYMEVLKIQRRCFNCFSNTHTLLYCPADSTCRGYGCKMTAKHCHFFCGYFKTQARISYVGLVSCSVDAKGNFDNSRLHTVLFKMVNPESLWETLVRGFLDTGCTDTFMSEESARKGELPGLDKRIEFLLSSFGKNTAKSEGALVTTIFKSLDGSYVSPKVTLIAQESLIQDVDSFKLTQEQRECIYRGGYRLSDDEATVNGRLPVDIVIGQDLYYQLIKGAPVHGPDGLVLVDTVFGYALGGPVKSNTGVLQPRASYLKCQLPKGVNKFIDIENFPGNKPYCHAVPKQCISSEDVEDEGNQEVSGCLFCGEMHSPEQCSLFEKKEQFLQVLKAQDRCFNCFSVGHIIYFCPNPSRCFSAECKIRGKHSPLMCGDKIKHQGIKDHGLHKCTSHAFKITVEEEQTDLRRLADTETLGIKSEDKEESPILEQFNSEVRKDEEAKRVVIKLPWRHRRKKQLRSNFNQSFERTNNLYERLRKPSKEATFIEYNRIMEEQVSLGILEKVASLGTVEEVREKLKTDPHHYDFYMPCHEDSQIHYLAHQAVTKASTQKLRVVYDASAKAFKQAFSLNQCLEPGPSLIQSLADILTRFRLRKCAYTADIAKAFLQITVDPCDRDSLRLLWRDGDNVILYRFNRLPFGLSSSPFILAATLKYLLETSTMSSDEVQYVLRSFYVDDLVGSKDSDEEVVVEREKVQEVLNEGSMELRKWNSNSIVLKDLFCEGQDPLPEEESVLGMVWDTDKDTIRANNSRIVQKLSNHNTKEELYSVIAQVYDPMGLLSPYILLAKILLHQACLAKIDWKDKLTPGLSKEWEAWKADLPKISEVKYDRWVSFEGATEYELHGFCDASGEGLAACVYLVSKGNGKVQSRLLRCRTRVKSSKPMSMPRREMCATVLLALVMHTVAEAVKDLNITRKAYYTDSMNSLFWIVSDHLNWPVFVANRIKQVRDLSNTNEWFYIHTTQNPADLPSRGCSIDTLKDHQLFREGPRFLETSETPYLGKMDMSDIPEGCRKELPKVALAAKPEEVEPELNLAALISIESTNSYYELMKKTRGIYKAVAQMRKQRVPVNPQSWGIKKMELDWCRTIQKEYYEEEISYCKEENARTDKSKRGSKTRPQLVRSLSLFWDEESQLLRCSTRLQEASLGYSSANPILLPKDDKLTTMLITATHERVCHVGVKQTLSSLRAEFWVPQARRMVKRIVERCVKCRRVSASPFHLPPPPPLPKCRVTISRPFSNTGVDFCGPFRLRKQKKWYVAIFTCAVTRAVHFETLQDLSAESFLLAFKRFIGRRGLPELVISDNAKTFKCVAKKLRKIFESPALQKYLTERRVRWHFYVERAPWHGGFIETCVKLFKGVFKKLLGYSKLSSEEFRTMVVEAEQVVNSRPLTYLYEDHNEGEPLTPSKLLHGYNLTDLPPLGRGGAPERVTITTRAKVLERLQNKFWIEWSQGYLNELAERHFSQKVGKEEVREPKVGEVVLLRGEPHMPRNRWKLGVIQEVHKSFKGNRIRSVVVRVPKGKGYDGGEFRRSPKHVVPLEAEFDE